MSRRAACGSGGVTVPPRRLRSRVGVPGAYEFAEGGRQAARELSAALAHVGSSLDRFEAVLDLGCGSGRVLPRVAALAPRAVCTGCDVDREAIRWASVHHPALRWSASSFVPPLAFADESFDLVYSISMLTHLDRELQTHWLEEVHRLLRSGGTALLTVHGAYALNQFRAGYVATRWCPSSAFARGPLRDGEFVFVPYMRSIWNRAELPGVEGDYGLAFEDERYIRAHWSETLEIRAVLERAMTGWQDIVVCTKA